MAAAALGGLLFSPFAPAAAVSPASEATGPFILEVSNLEVAQQIPGEQFSIGEHDFVLVDGTTAHAWEEHSDVLSVEPQHTRHMTVTPDDTYFDLQWHLYQTNDIDIDATDAWDTTTGSADVVVAVIDSGVDVDHEDLVDNIWVNTGETADNGIDDDGNGYVDDVNGWDFVDSDKDPNPDPNGIDEDGDGSTDGGIVHGTHVAGLIGAAGNNGTGVSGVAWTVSIMALRSLDDEGSGTDQSIAEAMEYAADNGADVINLSLGAYGNSSELQAGVDYAQSAGVLIIAAAGNDGLDLSNLGFYPACATDVIGVAATNAADDASSFTNFGGGCIDVAAPGSSILSTLYTDDTTFGFTDDYGYLSGTSMATPVVSGAAAVLKAANPTFSGSDITNALSGTTDDIGLTSAYGSGRLNVASALENAITFPSIKAWTSTNKTKQIDSSERTNETTPYFTWSEGFDPDGIAGYWVSFGKNGSADPATVGTFQTTRNFTPSTDFDGNETPYYLRIKIEDNNGEISNAAASFEYLFDNTVKKPSTIGVELVQGGLRISWLKVTDEHVTGYEILRSAKNKGAFTSIASVAKTTTYYVDKTVFDERSYDYKVKTIDNLGNSSRTSKKTEQFHAIERLVVGPGPGHAPVIEVYETNTNELESTFSAYPSSMTHGVEVAVGDVDGDGVDEIITGTGDGAAPQVRVFEADGTVIGSFFAYDSALRTGVRIGVADTDKDGVDEIVTVPGPGMTPLVKRFTSKGNHLGTDFYALDGKFLGGAFIAGVDFDNDGKDELAIAAGPGGGAQVTVTDPETGKVEANFFAYDQATFKGGIRIAAANTDGEDGEEIITVPAVGTAHVQMFAREPGLIKQLNPGFFAFNTAYNTGFSIAAFDTNQTGQDELVVGSGPDTYSEVVVFNKKGTFYLSLTYPYDDFVGAQVAGGYFRL